MIPIEHTEPTIKYVAKTIAGLEEVLARELEGLGAGNIEILSRAVSFEGDKRLLYKSNLWLRTALRVLSPVHSFQMVDDDDLYLSVKNIPWENYMTVLQTLAVDAVVTNSELTHSHFVALRTKDAIVDRFRDVAGRRPSVDTENPHLKVNIHINGNECDVSLDSSGMSLHKRGYRVSIAEAPMSEVLAAGLVYLSGWDRESDFLDPMCGSGTLLIEAALIAQHIAPGIYRKEFGFMRWNNFDPAMWEDVKNEAFEQQVEFEYRILGSDISTRNLNSARANIRSARLHKDIELQVSSFEELNLEISAPPVFIIINPPYGERIVTQDIIGLYKSIGDTLKRHFAGSNAWVISSDHKALSFIGLRPSKRFTVWNGPLECKFAKFELYQGSKKDMYADADPEFEKEFEKEREEQREKSYEPGRTGIRPGRENRDKPLSGDRDSSKRDERSSVPRPYSKPGGDSAGKRSFPAKENQSFRKKESAPGQTARFDKKVKPSDRDEREKRRSERKTTDGKEWIPYEERTFRKPTIPLQAQPVKVKRPRKPRPDQEDNSAE